MSMHTTRGRWTAGFLTVTALAVVMELWASFDNSSNTDPWTFLITDHVPQGVGMGLVTLLVLWLPVHFKMFYNLRGKMDVYHLKGYRKYFWTSVGAAIIAAQPLIQDGTLDRKDWIMIGVAALMPFVAHRTTDIQVDKGDEQT